MVYVIGVLGFIGGFFVGQMALYFLLRHKTKEELLAQEHLKWTYGIFNWAVAIFGSYLLIKMYEQYFY